MFEQLEDLDLIWCMNNKERQLKTSLVEFLNKVVGIERVIHDMKLPFQDIVFATSAKSCLPFHDYSVNYITTL